MSTAFFLNVSHQIPQPICQEKFVRSDPKKWIRTSKSAVCCFTISWVTKNNPLGANNPFTVQLVKKFLMCFIFSKHILRDFPNFDKVFYFQNIFFEGFPPFFLTNIHINNSKNHGSPRFQHLRRAGGTWGDLR